MIINSYTLLYIILVLLLGIIMGIIMIMDEKKENIDNKKVSINMDIVEFLKNTNSDICKNDYNIPYTENNLMNDSEYEAFIHKEIFQKIKVV